MEEHARELCSPGGAGQALVELRELDRAFQDSVRAANPSLFTDPSAWMLKLIEMDERGSEFRRSCESIEDYCDWAKMNDAEFDELVGKVASEGCKVRLGSLLGAPWGWGYGPVEQCCYVVEEYIDHGIVTGSRVPCP